MLRRIKNEENKMEKRVGILLLHIELMIVNIC